MGRDWEGMGGDLRGDLRKIFFGIIGIIKDDFFLRCQPTKIGIPSVSDKRRQEKLRNIL